MIISGKNMKTAMHCCTINLRVYFLMACMGLIQITPSQTTKHRPTSNEGSGSYQKTERSKFNPDAYENVYKKHFSSYYSPESFDGTTRLAGLSTAWAEARWNFANFDLVETLNWDSLYYQYIPRVIQTQSPVAYYKLLMSFYANLKDGHSLIFAPQDLSDSIHAAIPINCRMVEGKAVIVRNRSNDNEYKSLKPGTILLELNDMEINQYVKTHVAPYFSFSTPHDSVARIFSWYLTRGALNETLKIKYVSPKGEILSQYFSRQRNAKIYPHDEGFSFSLINHKTALLTINTFYDDSLPTFLDSVFNTLPHSKNLIIDLRRNTGGNSGNAFQLLDRLTNNSYASGTSIVRQYRPTNRAWGDSPDELIWISGKREKREKKGFNGKVVVLTGPDTYSAAEDFVLAFVHLQRGRVIGLPTGGSTGQPLVFNLPLGGMGGVCSKRELMPDSTEFIGKGIAPDLLVNYTLEKVIAGQDEILNCAIEILNSNE